MTRTEIATHNARIVAAVHAIKRDWPRITCRRIVERLNDAGLTSSRGNRLTVRGLYRQLSRQGRMLTWWREWGIGNILTD